MTSLPICHWNTLTLDLADHAYVRSANMDDLENIVIIPRPRFHRRVKNWRAANDRLCTLCFDMQHLPHAQALVRLWSDSASSIVDLRVGKSNHCFDRLTRLVLQTARTCLIYGYPLAAITCLQSSQTTGDGKYAKISNFQNLNNHYSEIKQIKPLR